MFEATAEWDHSHRLSTFTQDLDEDITLGEFLALPNHRRIIHPATAKEKVGFTFFEWMSKCLLEVDSGLEIEEGAFNNFTVRGNDRHIATVWGPASNMLSEYVNEYQRTVEAPVHRMICMALAAWYGQSLDAKTGEPVE